MSESMKNEKGQENFKKYIGLVKKHLIVWDVFISIMDSLTFTFAKSRQLNEIILVDGELKYQLQIAKPSDESNLEFERC